MGLLWKAVGKNLLADAQVVRRKQFVGVVGLPLSVAVILGPLSASWGCYFPCHQVPFTLKPATGLWTLVPLLPPLPARENACDYKSPLCHTVWHNYGSSVSSHSQIPHPHSPKEETIQGGRSAGVILRILPTMEGRLKWERSGVFFRWLHVWDRGGKAIGHIVCYFTLKKNSMCC